MPGSPNNSLEATPYGQTPGFLIRDNDAKFGPLFARVASSSDIKILKTPLHAPRANTYCERFLGSVRRECLDHVLILHEQQLFRVLLAYAAYFNQARPHQGLHQQVPDASACEARAGPIFPVPVLGGLHHEYRRDVHPESAATQILTWPNAPVSAAAMIWYDATEGQLTAYASQLVGQSLAPADLAATFERICGDFWYYSLRMLGKLRRGEEWAARYEFTVLVTRLLHALLRLEVGAVGRWRASESAVGIEHVLSPQRLEQLAACIPGTGMPSLLYTLGQAVALASEVCTHIHAMRGWPWPEQLAARMPALLAMPSTAEPSPES